MHRVPPLLDRPRPRHQALRTAVSTGLMAALMVSLVACKDDATAEAATPAATALMASAPLVSKANVAAPPVIPSADSTTDAPAAGPASTALAPVHAQLETTLAGAAACTVDTDCHSVAVGAKACGGPTGYQAFSGKHADVAGVMALAQHERDLAAAAARESHQASACFMLADPGAHCQQAKCVTGPPGTP